MSMKPWQKRRKSEGSYPEPHYTLSTDTVHFQIRDCVFDNTFAANTSTTILLAEDQEVEVHSYHA